MTVCINETCPFEDCSHHCAPRQDTSENTAHFCCCKDKGCGDCRREFWMQEVE